MYIKNNREILKNKEDNFKSLLPILDVLGDLTRLKVLFLLKENQKLYVSDLAKIIGISQGAISYQISMLERSGLINKNREGQRIACSLIPNKLIANLFSNLQSLKKQIKK